MGTWGPGNFDSDDAVDYLSEVIGGFVDPWSSCSRRGGRVWMTGVRAG
jgi:hypothetical protein